MLDVERSRKWGDDELHEQRDIDPGLLFAVPGMLFLMYSHRLRSILSAPERKVFQKLTTPHKIQDYLDTLPVNFAVKKDTYMSPRRVVQERTAHCFEGALFAAAAFAYHGKKPLLMDFRSIAEDEDHVVAPFRFRGYWGAVSKTNHAVLRYRDPVYRSLRELAMSYFHEYFLFRGPKTLREYGLLDLSKIAPEKWLVAQEELQWLVDKLDGARHFPTVPKKILRFLRSASPIERKALHLREWKPPKGYKSHG